jgi:hypothetical protein
MAVAIVGRSQSMKVSALVALLAVGWITAPAAAQTSADSTAIREVVLDYVDGWWAGDAERMARALHPDLVKRNVFLHRETGRSMMNSTSKHEMVEYTRSGGGSENPELKGEVVVRILDLVGDIANVFAASDRYVDYLHLVKWNGKWVIVNVLWGSR